MTDAIDKRNDAPSPSWSPLRAVRALLGRSPRASSRRVAAARRAAPSPPTPGWRPRLDAREGADAFVFAIDVPGARAEDLEVTASGRQLHIAGARTVEPVAPGAYHARERAAGRFHRSFTLPASADLAGARSELADGVLTVRVPKAPRAQARRIATAGTA